MAPTQLMERPVTAVTTPSDTTQSATQATPAIPSYSDIIERVVREYGVTPEVGRAFYTILEAAARENGDPYHLTALELETVHDSVLDLAMPDGVHAPRTGSIHDDVDAHFSEMMRRPVALVHGKTVEGLVSDCNVTMMDVARH